MDGDRALSLKLLLPPVSAAREGPLYAQVVEGIKSAVSRGALAPHQQLASFRQLAAELMVSVITVKRAYEELEQEGIIYRKQGLGTFVADAAAARTRDSLLHNARELLRQAAVEMRAAGLSPGEQRRLVLETINPQANNE
jgi:GntR family transcriptional regulator